MHMGYSYNVPSLAKILRYRGQFLLPQGQAPPMKAKDDLKTREISRNPAE